MEDNEIIKKRELRKAVIEEDRHKELAGTLRGIAKLLGEPKKDDTVADAIKKQGEALNKVAAAIANQPKPEKPEVNVEVSNKELLPLLKDIKDGNDKILKSLESKPMVESFDFQYDNWSNIKTAKVNYKPMSQIKIKK